MRILVADDHEVVRRGLRSLLAHGGWEVCAECSNGREAVQRTVALGPDVAVLDVTLPDLDGRWAAGVRCTLAQRAGHRLPARTLTTAGSPVYDPPIGGDAPGVHPASAARYVATAAPALEANARSLSQRGRTK